MNLPELLTLNAKLNPLAASERTQHAIAGEAAVGLARMTADHALILRPSFEVLSYVQKMNQFAQKAELSRRILERYFLGTEVDRIEPVFVPATPMSYSAYSFPSQDPSILKSEHMPYDLNDWKLRMNQWRGAPAMARIDPSSLLVERLARHQSIKNFI